MSISNVHGKSGGVCFLPACTSLYWQTIYMQMDIRHLSAVAAALPWFLNSIVGSVLRLKGALYESLKSRCQR